MQENPSNQNAHEISYSLHGNTVHNATLAHESNDGSSETSRYSLQKFERLLMPLVTRMVPCPPCTWG